MFYSSKNYTKVKSHFSRVMLLLSDRRRAKELITLNPSEVMGALRREGRL
jgi:hypothetical protein